MPEDLRQAPASKSRIADGGFLSRPASRFFAGKHKQPHTNPGMGLRYSGRIERRTHQSRKTILPADAVAILLNGDNVRRGPVSTVASEPVVVGGLGGAAVDGGAVIVETVV